MKLSGKDAASVNKKNKKRNDGGNFQFFSVCVMFLLLLSESHSLTAAVAVNRATQHVTCIDSQSGGFYICRIILMDSLALCSFHSSLLPIVLMLTMWKSLKLLRASLRRESSDWFVLCWWTPERLLKSVIDRISNWYKLNKNENRTRLCK